MGICCKTTVTLVEALTHGSAISWQEDDSFAPQFVPHALDNHFHTNVQISLTYPKEFHQENNNNASQITNPLYLKAKESKNTEKILTGFTNDISKKNYATILNIASGTFQNRDFLSNITSLSFLFSNPLNMLLLKLNERRLLSQGKDTVDKKNLKNIIKHSNRRLEEKNKTLREHATQHQTLFDTRLREITQHSNRNRSMVGHKNYTQKISLYKKQQLSSATHSKRTKNKTIEENYTQNASRLQNHTKNATTQFTSNHDSKSENDSSIENKSSGVRHNNISTSNVRKAVSPTNTSYHSGYKNNTLANSSNVGYESSRKYDSRHFFSNRTVKNGSLHMFPTSPESRIENTDNLLKDDMEILLLRSEQKKKKSLPSERFQKKIKWLKWWINSQKEPIYFNKELLQELENRGTELTKQVCITPAHRAALTTDIQQAGKLFLTMSRRQHKKRVLKTGTMAALLYLANLNSQGYAVDMTFTHVSFKQRALWRSRHHVIIRKVLFETLLELIEELTVPRTKNFPPEFANISIISKMRLLRSLAPSLCRLRRSIFDPITGECVAVQDKKDQEQSLIILPASPFYDNHGLEDTNFFSLD